MADDLVEFLRARLSEDEESVRAAMPGPWTNGADLDHLVDGIVYGPAPWPGLGNLSQVCDTRASHAQAANAAHIARHDPARVLAEVEAKRAVLALFDIAKQHMDKTRRTAPEYRLVQVSEIPYDALLCAVQALALPYAGHPNYREEWRPVTQMTSRHRPEPPDRHGA